MILIFILFGVPTYLTAGVLVAKIRNEKIYTVAGNGKNGQGRDRTNEQAEEVYMGVGVLITLLWPLYMVGLAFLFALYGAMTLVERAFVPTALRKDN